MLSHLHFPGLFNRILFPSLPFIWAGVKSVMVVERWPKQSHWGRVETAVSVWSDLILVRSSELDLVFRELHFFGCGGGYFTCFSCLSHFSIIFKVNCSVTGRGKAKTTDMTLLLFSVSMNHSHHTHSMDLIPLWVLTLVFVFFLNVDTWIMCHVAYDSSAIGQSNGYHGSNVNEWMKNWEVLTTSSVGGFEL